MAEKLTRRVIAGPPKAPPYYIMKSKRMVGRIMDEATARQDAKLMTMALATLFAIVDEEHRIMGYETPLKRRLR